MEKTTFRSAKGIVFLVATLVTLAVTAKPKVIDRPYFEGANTEIISIVRVELTKKSTTLYIHANYRPQDEIRISSATTLEVDGAKFALTGAEGITPDSSFTMPDSGEADFRLMFEPLPKDARSFDFMEGEEDDVWRIWGVALDSDEHDTDYPAGLPVEFRKDPTDGSLPKPVFTSGKTKVRIHLLGNKNLLRSEISMITDDVFGGQKKLTLNFDSDGVAEVEFAQHGTVTAFIGYDNSTLGNVWIAPGDDMEIYIDGRVVGYNFGSYNFLYTADGGYRIEKNNSRRLNPHGYIYSTGRYADLNRFYSMYNLEDAYETEDNKLSYQMTGDEYTAEVARLYHSIADTIASKPWPKMVREMAMTELQLITMLRMRSLGELLFLYDKEARRYTEIPYDSLRVRIEPRHIHQIGQLFDLDSPFHLMNVRLNAYLEIMGDCWSDTIPDNSQRLRLANARELKAKYADNGRLDELCEDYRSMVGDELAAALEAIDTEAKQQSARLGGMVQPVPDVPLDSLFSAIIEPHRGKVVLIDFWNTWCAPCRAAIKQNEPLKDGVLSSPDLIWIYIADESSPIADYTHMIPSIRGLHYRLDREQWKQLTNRDFPEIDGIPAYVLVKRDGTYALRLDFRDHETMIGEMKKALERALAE